LGIGELIRLSPAPRVLNPINSSILNPQFSSEEKSLSSGGFLGWGLRIWD
jgi:hypothetical protein